VLYVFGTEDEKRAADQQKGNDEKLTSKADAPSVKASTPAEQESAPTLGNGPEASNSQSTPESAESDAAAHISTSLGSPESNGEGAAQRTGEPVKTDLANLKVQLIESGGKENVVSLKSQAYFCCILHNFCL